MAGYGRPAPDLCGKVFARLTVLYRHGTGANRSAMWKCRCACGNEAVVQASLLRGGKVKSCGCLRVEIKQTHGNAKHGRYSREYVAWASMKDRCHNRSRRAWKHYGGRGISVCERWDKSFENFLADMGLSPSEKHSLDRINNEGNYEPDNCRWATKQEQCGNTRRTVMLTMNGVTQSRIEWCNQYGVAWHTIRNRMKAGLSLEEALKKPVGKYIKRELTA